jgi:hypothetical protein
MPSPTADTPITLTLGLVNGVLQYLGTRPYQEVFQMVQAIQEQAAPQVPKEPAAPTE